MRHGHRWMAELLIVSGLLLSACAPVSEHESARAEPATVEPIEGTDLLRVTLTVRAAERLDIQTASVEAAADAKHTIIPYAAVFYTANGDTWTYTSPEPLTFVRAPIVIEHIDGDLAFLSDGPPSGTAVVTRGAAELFGTETGVEE